MVNTLYDDLIQGVENKMFSLPKIGKLIPPYRIIDLIIGSEEEPYLKFISKGENFGRLPISKIKSIGDTSELYNSLIDNIKGNFYRMKDKPDLQLVKIKGIISQSGKKPLLEIMIKSDIQTIEFDKAKILWKID